MKNVNELRYHFCKLKTCDNQASEKGEDTVVHADADDVDELDLY